MHQLQSVKSLIRKLISFAGERLGVYQARFKRWSKSGNSVVLMYHRIASPESTTEYLEPGMYIRPETFALHCKLLKTYFDVVPLSDLFQKTTNNHIKPQCAITFDDGWADFLLNAFPILEASSLPATVYLPTSYIGTEKMFWTDECSDALKRLYQQKKIPQYCGTNSIVKEIIELKGDFVFCVDTVIKELKPYSSVEINEIVSELSRFAGVIEKTRQVFLTWDEVRKCKNSGLVSFGSHTANHLILTTESEQTVVEELHRSREKLLLEQAADPLHISFCYPNGGYSKKIQELVMKAGYSSAVTTMTGWNSRDFDLYSLKRIGMHQDMTSTKSLTLARIGMVSN